MRLQKIYLHCVVLLCSIALSGCSDDKSDNAIPRRDIELSRSETQAANGETYFAINLLKQSIIDTPNNNIVVGPYNVASVLACLANGADNTALNEITTALNVSDSDLTSLNSLFAKLYSELPTLDNRVEFRNYNGAFIAPNHSFTANFTTQLKDYFNASVTECNLSTPQGIDMLNKLVYSNTGGMINNFLKEPKDCDFLLLSTSYFRGLWRTPFDAKNTKERDFYPEGKAKHKVTTMYSKVYCTAFYNDEYVYCRLPYGNAAFRLHIFMPTGYLTNESTPLNDFINKFDVDFWKENLEYGANKLFNSTISVYLPKFKQRASGKINSTLANLGVKEIFKSNPDCLDNILTGGNTTINEFLADTSIEVTESGTVAASAAAADGTLTSPGPVSSVCINHPFIFIIDEVSTGTILYAGAIRDL